MGPRKSRRSAAPLLVAQEVAPFRPPRSGAVGVEALHGGDERRRPTKAKKPDGYLLGSYRIATTPEPNSSRLTSFKSTRFDSPANNVGLTLTLIAPV